MVGARGTPGSLLARLFGGLFACLLGAPAFSAQTDASAPPDEGKRVYEFYCYQCHAYSGTGRTLASRTLNPPPRDFTSMESRTLTREHLLDAVRNGRPGTGMVAFGRVLGEDGVQAVVSYVIERFMTGEAPDERYHTAANGWPEHDRYAAAFPFATGEIPLGTAPDELDDDQLRGQRLFMGACITCHDGGTMPDSGPVWETRAVSYPRGRYDHRNPTAGQEHWDAISGASPYLRHERPPPLPMDADDMLATGAALFQDNCAFCHAADGTGRNWIGSFLQPRPRNLTDPDVMSGMTRQRLEASIRNGVLNTSMPAWGSVLRTAEIVAIVHYVDRIMYPLADAVPTVRGRAEVSPTEPPKWVRRAMIQSGPPPPGGE